MSDGHIISPYNINTFSSRQVMGNYKENCQDIVLMKHQILSNRIQTHWAISKEI